MTVPRLVDFVRSIIPTWRGGALTNDEQELGVHLRGNDPLHNALIGIINSRIGGRAAMAVPSDPVVCKAILDRDNELRWLLSRLDFVYRSPVSQPESEDGEQPA